MRRIALSAVLVALIGAAVIAQEPKLRFEVASVRYTAGLPADGVTAISESPISFVRSWVTVEHLIQIAYALPGYRVVDGPDWIRSVRFDVRATTAVPSTLEEKARMLQHLLAERFGLKVRREQRPLPIYSLVFSNAAKQFGPSLRVSKSDCSAPERGVTDAPAAADGFPACVSRIANGGADPRVRRIVVRGRATSELVGILESLTGRVVVDRTGLSGAFDIDVIYAREAELLRPNSTNLPDAPSLFAALPDQLGLRLESGREPVQVLVVESVQQPTEN